MIKFRKCNIARQKKLLTFANKSHKSIIGTKLLIMRKQEKIATGINLESDDCR